MAIVFKLYGKNAENAVLIHKQNEIAQLRREMVHQDDGRKAPRSERIAKISQVLECSLFVAVKESPKGLHRISQPPFNCVGF